MNHRLVALVGFLLAGCHSSGDGAADNGDNGGGDGPCAFADTACDAPESQLAACTAPDGGGVYGTETVTTVQRPGPGATNGTACGSRFGVEIFVDDGDAGPPFPGQSGDAGPYVQLAVKTGNGYYSAALDAGAYWLCCADQPNYPTCMKLSIGVGEVARYDLAGSVSVGGTPCSFSKR